MFSLQCVIPCIEGLVPNPLGRVVNTMLWNIAVWHALGKLRLHTEKTVQILEAVTTELGRSVRRFKKESAYLDTRELPKEEAARGRRKAALSAAKGAPTPASMGKKHKTLNLSTIKWHSAGYIGQDVRDVGPTDIYSTQTVWQSRMFPKTSILTSLQGETEHKRVKRFYALTNKAVHEGQIAAKQQREQIVTNIKKRDPEVSRPDEPVESSEKPRKRGRPRKTSMFQGGDETLEKVRCDVHHHISDRRRDREDIVRMVSEHPEDPALKVRSKFSESNTTDLTC